VLFDQDLTESDHAVNRSQEDWIGSKTRSQAVARIADRTAAQHLWGHVTSSATWPFESPFAISYWWSFGIGTNNQASISNGFRDIQWRMWRNGWDDLKWPLKWMTLTFV